MCHPQYNVSMGGNMPQTNLVPKKTSEHHVDAVNELWSFNSVIYKQKYNMKNEKEKKK